MISTPLSQSYQSSPLENPKNLEDRYGFKKSIEAVKEEARIEWVAAEYGNPKLLGSNRLLDRCPHPDHADRTPSFTIFTDTQRFKCFGIGCGISGDVIDLEKLCGGHTETWTAMIALAQRYNIGLPERPRQWNHWQNEKGRRREMIRAALAEAYRRRFFRVYGSVYLADIADEEEREKEAKLFWDSLWPVARAAAKWRMAE